MNNMEIRFESPLWLLAFLPVAALTLWISLRVPGKRGSVVRVLPLVFRLVAAAAVTVIMAGLTFVTDRADTAMLLLLDRSDSMESVMEPSLSAAQEIVQNTTDGTMTAMMSFAGESKLNVGFTRQPTLTEPGIAGGNDSTNLAQALRSAAELFPENHLKRVVLLTDGLVTDGDTMTAAALLLNRGIRMDILPVAAGIPENEVQADLLQLPADSMLGSYVRAAVRIRSSAACQATVQLSDSGKLLREEPVTLRVGENSFSWTIPASVPGTRVITATVQAECDTTPENNEVSQVMQVISTDGVLIVDGNGAQGEPLCSLLQSEGMEVTVVAPQQLPSTITGLCEYSLVILVNVDLTELPLYSSDHLHDYVSVYGRSVLTVGGDHTFMNGHMQESTLEEVLPVTIAVTERESTEPAALLLLIDNSASMEGAALVMAKRGAIKCLQALNDNDYAGVISFSTEFGTVFPLSSMEDRERAVEEISGLGTVMGTMYNGALAQAMDQMDAFEYSTHKHIILLSDGNPGDTGCQDIVHRMRQKGITVSTVAVGRDIDEALMERLAELGGGTCYVVHSAYDLPSIMLTDTMLQTVDYTPSGSFEVISRRALKNSGKLPVITGYNRVTVKPQAEVLLETENGHPLYAMINSGMGQAGALMTSPGQWASGWMETEEGRETILDLVSGLLPEKHMSEAIRAELTPGGTSCMLTVYTAEEAARAQAQVFSPQGTSTVLRLNRVEEGVWQRSFAIDGFGRYDISLAFRDKAGNLIASGDTAGVISRSSEYDRFAVCDDTMLKETAALTGGLVLSSVQELVNLKLDDMVVEYDPLMPLALLAGILLLLDIVIRRTRLQRTTQLFRRLLSRKE